MRRWAREAAIRLSHLARNPGHVGDLGEVWVELRCCADLRCSLEWAALSRRDEEMAPGIPCPKCGTRRSIPMEDRFRALAEVNARAGVLRYQRLDQTGTPRGTWHYVPWSRESLPSP